MRRLRELGGRVESRSLPGRPDHAPEFEAVATPPPPPDDADGQQRNPSAADAAGAAGRRRALGPTKKVAERRAAREVLRLLPNHGHECEGSRVGR